MKERNLKSHGDFLKIKIGYVKIFKAQVTLHR